MKTAAKASSDHQQSAAAPDFTHQSGSSTWGDSRPQSAVQRGLVSIIQQSPQMAAQRKLTEMMHQGLVAQRQRLQGMFGPVRKHEPQSEELLQGKLTAAASSAMAPLTAAAYGKVANPGSKPVVQAFGIDDRQWDQMTTISHLGATAYKASAPDGAVVIKKSGSGKVEYQLGSEGPTQETLASKVGEIPGFGVKTAKTVMIPTAGEEGQTILGKLKALGGLAAELAQSLAGTESFLVMELAIGNTLEKSGDAIGKAAPEKMATWFYGLGRLWVFDVLIHNTDRFMAGNWGNVIFGEDGLVYGIDQMVGLNASKLGETFAGEYAGRELGRAINPEKRREYGKQIFLSLSDKLGMPFSRLEAQFVLNFESGMLVGIVEAGGVTGEELQAKQAEMPDFAEEAAAGLGLQGTAVMLKVFAENMPKAEQARVEFQKEIEGRKSDAEIISNVLAPIAELRGQILGRFQKMAGQLQNDWTETNAWFLERNKKTFWIEKQQELDKSIQSAKEEYYGLHLTLLEKVGINEGSEILSKQLEVWASGFKMLCSKLTNLTKGVEKTAGIKEKVENLKQIIMEERLKKIIPWQL
jgi:hypothetical protein